MDAALEAMHTWKYALLRWRINNKHFSESLEQLASYNGADMYNYNMLYTFKINEDVLTPESLVYKTEDAKHRFYMRRAAKRIANIIDLCYNKVCQVFTALVSDKAHGNEDWNE